MANRESFSTDFRRFFGRGLVILLPSVLTLWILYQLALFVFKSVALPINRGIRIAVIEVTPMVFDDKSMPSWFRVTDQQLAEYRLSLGSQPQAKASDEKLRHQLRRRNFETFWSQHWYLEATGLVVAIVLIYFAGLLLGGLIGRKAYHRIEKGFSRIPGFKQVYPHVKQLVEMVIGDRPIAFNRVVMVQYPRAGVWTIGLVTGGSLRSMRDRTGAELITIFIPSTPTPFTGFAINVPKGDVFDLPISIEEALRFFITGGALVPDREATGAGPVRPPDVQRLVEAAVRARGEGEAAKPPESTG